MPEDSVHIQIPHYPPFQLRSSLIDKDPVIWVHLLDGYIQLCQALLSGDIKLDVKSQQQLQLFLKVFLAETAEEKSKIFSLGAINPEIKENTAALRAYVFQLICDYGVVKLAFTGESLWNFVLVYVEKNASFVRRILSGAHMSKFNDNKKSGKISSVPVLKKHLISQITSGKMQHTDLQALSMLLGQHIKASTKKSINITKGGNTGEKVLAKDKYNQTASGALQFAEHFVTDHWVEDLEGLYAGGKSVNAKTIKDWMVVSVLSLSSAKLATVISTIGINGPGSFPLSPLLSAIILSDAYKSLAPGLDDRLPFLKNLQTADEVDERDVHSLIDMFPDLTENQARRVLRDYNSLEEATHMLLEDPSLMADIPDTMETKPKPVEISQSELERGMERFKLGEKDTFSTFTRAKASDAKETRNRTLTAALRLMYDSEEDERDDTYDAQEDTSGAAFLEFDKKPKGKDKARLVVFEDDDTNRQTPEQDPKEMILFKYLIEGGDSLFSKTSRKSATREQMRTETQWSDEQIEGWSRMLKRTSKRFRLLGEAYAMENANRKKPISSGHSTKSNTPKKGPKSSNAPTKVSKEASKVSKDNPKVSKGAKAQQRKETNKAQNANHSRKSGHSKKTRAELVGMREQ